MTVYYEDCILGPDTTANRPAVTVAPEGALYVNTTTNVVEKNTGAAWVEYFDPQEDQ